LEYLGVDGKNKSNASSKSGMDGMDWTNLAQDRNRWRTLVKMVMDLRVPLNAGNFLTTLGYISFSERTPLHAVS
jgi:hypothetical protein